MGILSSLISLFTPWISVSPNSFTQLSPAPGEQDFLYYLGDKEGICDLYDLNNDTTAASS